MRQILLVVIGLVWASAGIAQRSRLDDFTWKGVPTVPELMEEDKKAQAVILFRRYEVDYFVPAGITYNRVYEKYLLFHTAILINDDRGIENFNQVVLPISSEGIKQIKARTIKPDGTIQEFNQSNLKQVRVGEAGISAKIFAVEGLEKGSIIEYYYVIKSYPSIVERLVLQSEQAKVIEASVLLSAKRSWQFITKSYNGFPEFNSKAVEGSDIAEYAAHYNLPAIPEEPYSNNQAYMEAVEWRLDIPTALPFDWAAICENISSAYVSFPQRPASFTKLIEPFLKITDWGKRLTAVDQLIKKQFSIRRDAPTQKLADILKNKYANTQDYYKLYATCLEAAGMPFQWIATSNRQYKHFDPSFPSYSSVQELMIYVAKPETYICVDDPTYPAGMVPYYVAGNEGIIFKKRSYRNVTLPLLSIKDNFSHRDLTVTIPTTGADLPYTVSQEYMGQRAAQIRRTFTGITAENYTKFLQVLLTGDLSTVNIVSADTSDVSIAATVEGKPLKIAATMLATNAIEVAGEDLIVQIGRLIGQQSDLYDKPTRQLPIEHEHPFEYKYLFKVTIPEGYAATNLEELNTNFLIEGGKEGTPTAGFTSSYALEGNLLTIYAQEFYTTADYPVEQYSAFRDVINAAANFSKLSIVLSKQ